MSAPDSAPDLPDLPRDAAGKPVFPGPWQARAFALATHLSTRGAFAWPDFTAALAEELARGDDYWRAWLRALETLLARERLAAPGAVAETAARWERAAEQTPHGRPIRLEAAN